MEQPQGMSTLVGAFSSLVNLMLHATPSTPETPCFRRPSPPTPIRLWCYCDMHNMFIVFKTTGKKGQSSETW